MNIILASASSRRKKILKNSGYSFKVVPSKYDENICGLNFSKELIENCAYNKAKDVFKKHRDDIVVSADTVVVLDNTIIGKPKDKKEAFDTLKKLSYKTHFVATGICILSKEKCITSTDITCVTFRKLSDDEITNYIISKNPLDKAGSYGIQDEGFDFCTEINGEMDNVIGFPMKLFKEKFIF